MIKALPNFYVQHTFGATILVTELLIYFPLSSDERGLGVKVVSEEDCQLCAV